MKANTIKLEDKLLTEIMRVKPKEQSLSSFVKGMLAKELQRIRIQQAARQYADYLRSDTDEAAELAEWERADLTSASRAKRFR